MSDRFDEAAQRLAEYIRSLPDFVYREVGDPYDHIGYTNRGMLDHSVWYYVGEKKRPEMRMKECRMGRATAVS